MKRTEWWRMGNQITRQPRTRDGRWSSRRKRRQPSRPRCPRCNSSRCSRCRQLRRSSHPCRRVLTSPLVSKQIRSTWVESKQVTRRNLLNRYHKRKCRVLKFLWLGPRHRRQWHLAKRLIISNRPAILEVVAEWHSLVNKRMVLWSQLMQRNLTLTLVVMTFSIRSNQQHNRKKISSATITVVA